MKKLIIDSNVLSEYNLFIGLLFNLVAHNVWPSNLEVKDYSKVVSNIKMFLSKHFYNLDQFCISLDWFEEPYSDAAYCKDGFKLTIVYNNSFKFESTDRFGIQDILYYLEFFNFESLQSK